MSACAGAVGMRSQEGCAMRWGIIDVDERFCARERFLLRLCEGDALSQMRWFLGCDACSGGLSDG